MRAVQLPDNSGMDQVLETASDLDLGLQWRNGFAGLGPAFHTRLRPQALPAPYWVVASQQAARELGLGAHWLQSPELLQALSGNRPIAGTVPMASVYSGHQFGVWAGQLGDGRAILLGETDSGLEVQLKGSGLTPYSRMGDGRAVLRSTIREFLCSEAMHALGIPTTRALCVTGSDAPVRREEVETAAVLTRLAPSFIRFGHFEHFSSTGQIDELRRLADFVIERYYPGCLDSARFAGNRYCALLEKVSERTAQLLAQWQAVGFCHGVMNTDNMSILGLTIDYGPYQFLDGFDPGHICNHSDTGGRYAYNRQPNVAYWNLFCLGQALLPLIDDQEQALAALETYKTAFPPALETRLCAKLGLGADPCGLRTGDRELVERVLQLLAAERVDYTIFWRRLSHWSSGAALAPVRDLFLDAAGFDAWLLQYAQRLELCDRAAAAARMLATNPKFVLRNHLGEQAIAAAKAKDYSLLHTLADVLLAPFAEQPQHQALADFPPHWAGSIEISCSS